MEFCRDCKYHDHIKIFDRKDPHDGKKYILVECEKCERKYLPSDFRWSVYDVAFKQACPYFLSKQIRIDE